MSEARVAAEVNPSQENNTQLQQAKPTSQAQDTSMPKRLERKNSLLNFEKDGRKFWKLTKQLSDEETPEKRSPWKKTVSYWLGNKLLTNLLKTMQMRARFSSVLQSREKQ